MSREDFSKKIIDVIKEEKLTPKSRWIFRFKNSLEWLFVVIVLLSGSFSLGIIIFIFFSNDFVLSDALSYGGFFKNMPFLWFIVLIVFIILGDRFIRWTKNGYRYSYRVLSGAVVLTIVLIGIFIHWSGVAEKADYRFGRHSAFYRDFGNPHYGEFFDPERGIVIGKVVTLNEDGFFLDDIIGSRWTVIFSSSSFLRADMIVRVIGNAGENSLFYADIVRPLRPELRKNLPRRDDMFKRLEKHRRLFFDGSMKEIRE